MAIYDESNASLTPETGQISNAASPIEVLTGAEVLTGLNPIRVRPDLYVGRLDDPTVFNPLIQMALCIAIDEAIDGYCTEIQVQVASDWSVTVSDNGRGLSMTPDGFEGQVLTERLLTWMLCGSRIPEKDREEVLWNVDLVKVNALSEWVRVRNCRDGFCWVQEYHCDVYPVAPFA